MVRNTLCRTLVLTLVALAFALTPVLAQAAPRAAGDGGTAWDLIGALHQLWDVAWGHDERGPTIDPGVRVPVAAPVQSVAPQPAVGRSEHAGVAARTLVSDRGQD